MELKLDEDEMAESSSKDSLETGPESNLPATVPEKSFVVVKVFSPGSRTV